MLWVQNGKVMGPVTPPFVNMTQGGAYAPSGDPPHGFLSLPVPEAERLRRFLRFPESGCAAIDPCVGDGVAFAALTGNAPVLRYGIELDSYRAQQARERVQNVIQGNALEAHCPVESLSLLYENCPYGPELGQDRSQRMEQIFLTHTYRWR